MVAPYQGKPPATPKASLQPVVDTARRAAPEMTPSFIAFPGTLFTSRHHYAVFLRGDTPWSSRLLKPALVDAETGALTDMRDLPWYVTTLLVSQPLHFGDYGGMPLKLIWAGLDAITIVVLGSGLYLWIRRRRTPADDPPRLAGWMTPPPRSLARGRCRPAHEGGRRSGRVGRHLKQRTFAWPLLLSVLSGLGLVLALLGDGVWDAASWLLLSTPIVAVVLALASPQK